MTLKDFVKFQIVGTDKNNKRFNIQYSGNSEGYATAMNINLWNGSVYGILPNGKKIKLKSVTN